MFMINHTALLELFSLISFIRVIDKSRFSLSFTTIHGSVSILNAAKLLWIATRHMENGTSSFDTALVPRMSRQLTQLYHKINIIYLSGQFYHIHHHVLLVYLEKIHFVPQ